jgi:toxin ParE1/3/4
MQVRWTTPAAQDLEDITLYIQKDSEAAARSVAKALFDAANSLNFLPSRGRIGRIPGTRELVVPGLPYIILYEVADTAIQIFHIYHGARNWESEQ